MKSPKNKKSQRKDPATVSVRVPLTAEMQTAIQSYVAAQGGTTTEVMRRLILEVIGRPDLIATMRSRGRPWPSE